MVDLPLEPRTVFLSYVHEDSEKVDDLQRALEIADLEVWRDIKDIPPAAGWRSEIENAIDKSVAFIACFSPQSAARDRTHQREEILLAIDKARTMATEASWIFSVRLGPVDLPFYRIDANRTLSSLQHLDLFGPREADQLARLISALKELASKKSTSARTASHADTAPETTEVPLSREAWLEIQKRVFESDGLHSSMRTFYPHFQPLQFCGFEFPVWSKLAAPRDRKSLDSALGKLLPGQDPRQDGYPDEFDPAGEAIYRERLRTQDPTTSFNGPTYALERIHMEGDRVKVDAKHGTYFHSLATSESLEKELVLRLAAEPEKEVELEDLPRRRWLHDVAGGEYVVLDGRHRAAALSVSATFLITQPDGTYRALLARRSKRVATHPSFWHVAPSGVFQALGAKHRNNPKEFSVRNSILREYAEELFHYLDLEKGDGPDAEQLLKLEPIRALERARKQGLLSIHYCGISVPLLTLRPEFSVLIFVKDPTWFDREIKRVRGDAHEFALNWEYEKLKWHEDPSRELDALLLELDSNFVPVDRDLMRPSVMLPHAAAALHLSTSVARELARP